MSFNVSGQEVASGIADPSIMFGWVWWIILVGVIISLIYLIIHLMR